MTTAGMTPTLEWCNQCCAFHRNGHPCQCLEQISRLKSEIADRERKIAELRNISLSNKSEIESLKNIITAFQSGVQQIITDRCGSDVFFKGATESVPGVRIDSSRLRESSDGTWTVEESEQGTLAHRDQTNKATEPV